MTQSGHHGDNDLSGNPTFSGNVLDLDPKCPDLNLWVGHSPRRGISKMTPEEQQERVRSSFAKQGLMTTLGATLGSVSPGMVEIALSPHPAISQQHGFVHAGAVSAIADTAAGYAALTLMPADTGVLTTEFKINLLAPAAGERILARGRVVKAGRTLTLAQAEVFANTGGQEKLIALLTATLMAVKGRDAISDWDPLSWQTQFISIEARHVRSWH
jgi:uncharacterized protein (TIGR00369 family)